MDFGGETHNAPCGGFDCRNEGSAYVAGVEDGSEIRNKSTPVLAAVETRADALYDELSLLIVIRAKTATAWSKCARDTFEQGITKLPEPKPPGAVPVF
jgi:hypothetical protein